MIIEYHIIDGVPTIQFKNDENLSRYFVHLWKKDDRYEKNTQRLAVSGWISGAGYNCKINTPGIYYGIYFDANKNKYVTGECEVTWESLLNNNLAKSIKNNSMNEYKSSLVLEKLSIVGTDYFVDFLINNYGVKNKRLNLYFNDYEFMKVANAISSMYFFNNKIEKPRLISNEVGHAGYLFSRTFEHRVYDSRVQCDKNDYVLNIEGMPNSIKDKFESNDARILNFDSLLQEAFVEKYLVDQLNSIKNKTIYIKFPVLKDVKNPSEIEKNRSNITIGKVRSEVKNNILPESLSRFNDDGDYAKNVMEGWRLDTTGDYDKMVDRELKYSNISDGYRVIPDNGKKLINGKGSFYFFGNSVMFGVGSDDAHTIPAYFAKKTNYSSKMRANFSMNDFVRGVSLMKGIDFKDDDVVVFGGHVVLSERQQKSIDMYIDMTDEFSRPHDYGEIFTDMTHMNKVGYEIIADALIHSIDNLHN
ncbi:hypothetical protein ACJQWY_02030 [Weissella kandleri]|uniref:hypothetical protein n=1 Tax=Weissella kandleri TaxID=1616 RepID=UPI00387EBE5D